MATRTAQEIFYFVDDVMELLGVSRSKAYSTIRDLNLELKEKGMHTISGRVPKKYFNEKFYCDIESPGVLKYERSAKAR